MEKFCLFCWVKKLPWEKEDGMADTIAWVIQKVYILYTQHYIMAPLATIGLVSIYLLFIRLYRKNKALNLRLKRVEEQIKHE